MSRRPPCASRCCASQACVNPHRASRPCASLWRAPRLARRIGPGLPPAFLRPGSEAAAPTAPTVTPEARQPTVLKSGFIGGMAYTLYSDGSIEAELPDGVLRFGSLQELREHVAATSSQGGA